MGPLVSFPFCVFFYTFFFGGWLFLFLLDRVIGVANVNKTLAWEAWNKLTLNTQATRFPTLWPGVWSSADYMRDETGVSGGSGFPLLNSHRHAWPVVSLTVGLVGITFTSDGVNIRPWLPKKIGEYVYTSSLATVSRTANGTYSGSISPLKETQACNVVIELPDHAAASLKHARIQLDNDDPARQAEHATLPQRRKGWVVFELGLPSGSMCGGGVAVKWQIV